MSNDKSLSIPIKRFRVGLRESMRRVLELLSYAQLQFENRLTESEVKVLAEFLILPDKHRFHRFSTASRKVVLDNLLSSGTKISRTNLNGKLASIFAKHYLWRDDDSVLYAKKYLVELADRLIYAARQGTEFELKFGFDFSKIPNTVQTSKQSTRLPGADN